MKHTEALWPELPYEAWKDTLDTLHMWMQIVGKVKLALVPFINQWWEVAFYVTATGLTTGRIPYANGAFEVDFDFLLHTLNIQTSNNDRKRIPLEPRSVTDFYTDFMDTLQSMGIQVKIDAVPVEFESAIPFPTDITHASYDKDSVTRWWHILLQINLIFDQFRTPFRGKSSPIQFFWGSFDLSGTRFSGKTVTPPKANGYMEKIMQYAENEENFAFGFWPGDQKFPHAAFYSYLYPAPKGIETAMFKNGISFNEQLTECILLYDAVRKGNPERNIMNFLQTTYKESALLAGWDIESLQAKIPNLRYG